MAAPIPSVEPSEFQAGNSYAWTKTLDDYPADDGWTLSYSLRGTPPQAYVIDFSATADGSDFAISLTSATTLDWVPGTYTLAGYVTDGTNRYEVFRGLVTITPNISALTAEEGFDGRTYWQRIRDKLRLTIENGVIRDVIRYSYNGVSTEVVSMADAFKALAYAETMVAQESSRGKNRKILTRFVRPR